MITNKFYKYYIKVKDNNYQIINETSIGGYNLLCGDYYLITIYIHKDMYPKSKTFKADISICKYTKEQGDYFRNVYHRLRSFKGINELQKYLFMNDDNEVIHKIKQFIYYDIIL